MVLHTDIFTGSVVFCEHCKQTVCLILSSSCKMSYVRDKYLTPEEIERLLCEITDEEDFVLCTNLQLNDSSESSSDSESEEQRVYVYNWDGQNINNIVIPITFTGDSGVNSDIIQNLSQNSVTKEINIFNEILSDDFYQMIVLETNRYAQVELDTVDAVSYTHLDVYKRQGQELIKA